MKPLTGMRVVDAADVKGEFCGRLLADLGAEVIRVEPPEGALSRTMPPFAQTPQNEGGEECSLYFAVRNAGKRGAVLDLQSEAGRETLHRLLSQADVFIESARPGAMEKLGLGFAQLHARHPALVVTSITDFGQSGPYAEYQGTNMLGVALGGMLHRAGIPEKPPVLIPGHLAYDAAGICAAFGTLLAFWQRLHTGRGQHMDVSALDATVGLTDWSLPNYTLNQQLGHRSGTGIYNLYPCADGYIRMIVLVPKHWRALKQWMGDPEELRDPKYDQFIHRLVEAAKITPVLERFFAGKRKTEAAAEAQRRGIPATPLLRPAEVLNNEHTKARGTFKALEIAPGITVQVAAGFLTVEGEREGPESGPPALDGNAAAFGARRARAEFEALLQKAPLATAEGARPLAGLRVVDCGVGAVGVEVGRFFAEYGAEVIKIESSDAPDFIRVIMSSYMNPAFLSSNRSKQSFGVDLTKAKGRALVQQLVRRADVFVENNGSGTMAKLGLGPEQLREINPRIVSISSQSLGSAGPWKDWIGYGPNTHPVSGLQHLWNYPEDEAQPAGSTAVHPDHLVGRLGMFAALAGLIYRARSGKGSHADAAQFETPIGLLADLFAQESLQPGGVRPLGNANPQAAPWAVLPCAGEDEWCVINCRNDADWRQLVRVMGAPKWAQAPEYAGAAGRVAKRAQLEEALAEWTRTLEAREVMETLQSAGVPAAMVSHPGHHQTDPQLLHREFLKPVVQPGYETLLLEGPPFTGSDLAEPLVQPAPMLGEHTREIARTHLGLSAAEIETLIKEGVLEDPPKEFKQV